MPDRKFGSQPDQILRKLQIEKIKDQLASAEFREALLGCQRNDDGGYSNIGILVQRETGILRFDKMGNQDERIFSQGMIIGRDESWFTIYFDVDASGRISEIEGAHIDTTGKILDLEKGELLPGKEISISPNALVNILEAARMYNESIN